MRTAALALAATLVAGSAFAQATNSPPPPASPPAASAEPAGARPTPPPPGGPMRRGAYIKMEAPGGAEIAVRCADGESTRACADIVLDLVEKARAAARPDPTGGRRWDRDERYRDRDRGRNDD